MTAATVADRAGYHSIGDRSCRVAVTAATAAAQAGYHPPTIAFGVDMIGGTRGGHGVDVRRCWVPCNE